MQHSSYVNVPVSQQINFKQEPPADLQLQAKSNGLLPLLHHNSLPLEVKKTLSAQEHNNVSHSYQQSNLQQWPEVQNPSLHSKDSDSLIQPPCVTLNNSPSSHSLIKLNTMQSQMLDANHFAHCYTHADIAKATKAARDLSVSQAFSLNNSLIPNSDNGLHESLKTSISDSGKLNVNDSGAINNKLIADESSYDSSDESSDWYIECDDENALTISSQVENLNNNNDNNSNNQLKAKKYQALQNLKFQVDHCQQQASHQAQQIEHDLIQMNEGSTEINVIYINNNLVDLRQVFPDYDIQRNKREQNLICKFLVSAQARADILNDKQLQDDQNTKPHPLNSFDIFTSPFEESHQKYPNFWWQRHHDHIFHNDLEELKTEQNIKSWLNTLEKRLTHSIQNIQNRHASIASFYNINTIIDEYEIDDHFIMDIIQLQRIQKLLDFFSKRALYIKNTPAEAQSQDGLDFDNILEKHYLNFTTARERVDQMLTTLQESQSCFLRAVTRLQKWQALAQMNYQLCEIAELPQGVFQFFQLSLKKKEQSPLINMDHQVNIQDILDPQSWLYCIETEWEQEIFNDFIENYENLFHYVQDQWEEICNTPQCNIPISEMIWKIICGYTGFTLEKANEMMAQNYHMQFLSYHPNFHTIQYQEELKFRNKYKSQSQNIHFFPYEIYQKFNRPSLMNQLDYANFLAIKLHVDFQDWYHQDQIDNKTIPARFREFISRYEDVLTTVCYIQELLPSLLDLEKHDSVNEYFKTFENHLSTSIKQLNTALQEIQALINQKALERAISMKCKSLQEDFLNNDSNLNRISINAVYITLDRESKGEEEEPYIMTPFSYFAINKPLMLFDLESDLSQLPVKQQREELKKRIFYYNSYLKMDCEMELVISGKAQDLENPYAILIDNRSKQCKLELEECRKTLALLCEASENQGKAMI